MKQNQQIEKNAPGKHYREGISLIKLFQMFPDEKTAEQWFEEQRWGKTGLFCPRCGSYDKAKTVESRKPMSYWCGDCRQYFSVRTGTVMERSKIPLHKWAIAIYQITVNLKSVSSMKLHRDLEVTQKTAWFLMHRIRQAYELDPTTSKLDGPVEVDETYIGGKEKNKHKSKKSNAGRGTVGKAIVAGLKDRETKEIRAAVVEDTKRNTLHEFIAQHTTPKTKKFTDELLSYDGLDNHEAVKHSVGEYVIGKAHTNGIESFWSMLKRGYYGTFHHISVKHLHRYVAEFASRQNLRELDTIEQMQHVVAGLTGKRLMYAELIAEKD